MRGVCERRLRGHWPPFDLIIVPSINLMNIFMKFSQYENIFEYRVQLSWDIVLVTDRHTIAIVL